MINHQNKLRNDQVCSCSSPDCQENGCALQRVKYVQSEPHQSIGLIYHYSNCGNCINENGCIGECPKSDEVDSSNDGLPDYYNNQKGSLYKIALERGWNAYQFDIIKRIDRALKKGEFESDLQKTKALIDLWLKE